MWVFEYSIIKIVFSSEIHKEMEDEKELKSSLSIHELVVELPSWEKGKRRLAGRISLAHPLTPNFVY